MVAIRLITTQETYALRQLVLRPSRPIESCYFDSDQDESTFHLGGFQNDKLISIVTLMETEPHRLQLRGMATHPNFQGQSIGAKLLSEVKKISFKREYKSIWCNARERAISFYKREGFTSQGDIFDIPDVGPHLLMSIELS